MKMRVLVIGVEHFITARVQAALAESDWATPVPWIASSTTDPLAGVDAVFNGTAGRPAAIRANARRIYAALAASNAPIRTVHLSSMTVYGSHRGEVAENAPLRTDIGDYGAAHVEAEGLAAGHPHSVILRPGCEYGPASPDWTVRIARLLLAHRLGDLGAAGDGVCNLLFVDDLINAAFAALRAPAALEGQAFNLAMREPPTWNDYLVRFGRALGATPVSRIHPRRLRLESTLLAPVLKGLERAELRLGARAIRTPPAITPSLLSLCRQTITLNVHKAEDALGLQWTPLVDGLRSAAAPFRARAVA